MPFGHAETASSGQKLPPGADVVHVGITVFLQQQFRHAAARSAGAADDDGGRLGYFAQPAAQFLQGDIQGAGGVATGIFAGAAHVHQGGAALSEFGQQAGDFSGVPPFVAKPERQRQKRPVLLECV